MKDRIGWHKGLAYVAGIWIGQTLEQTRITPILAWGTNVDPENMKIKRDLIYAPTEEVIEYKPMKLLNPRFRMSD